MSTAAQVNVFHWMVGSSQDNLIIKIRSSTFRFGYIWCKGYIWDKNYCVHSIKWNSTFLNMEVSNDFIASEALRNFKVRWKLILIWLLLKSNKTMTYLLSVILKTTRLRNGITVDIYSVNYCSNYSRVFGVIKSITTANRLITKLAVLSLLLSVTEILIEMMKSIFHMERRWILRRRWQWRWLRRR